MSPPNALGMEDDLPPSKPPKPEVRIEPQTVSNHDVLCVLGDGQFPTREVVALRLFRGKEAIRGKTFERHCVVWVGPEISRETRQELLDRLGFGQTVEQQEHNRKMLLYEDYEPKPADLSPYGVPWDTLEKEQVRDEVPEALDAEPALDTTALDTMPPESIPPASAPSRELWPFSVIDRKADPRPEE